MPMTRAAATVASSTALLQRPYRCERKAELGKRTASTAKPQNETLRATRHDGRAYWTRWTGYQARSRIVAETRCLRALHTRIAARDPDRQTAEIQIRIALIARSDALGTAEAVRVA